ncbi:hypothetical protein GGH94_003442 [Coemansia aciculifera]|uniref:Uncharacterized protein n=1 Tax=Coemansia aciculifera TaxID=417176 RepID=A0A9W8IJE7_9FUNG|nr:hypothetical protein GGH94_003442 [Coemansia aciculifera]
MGTLGTQLAYVFYLGHEAATPRVQQWTPGYLTSDVLVWTQHIDLLWPTLSYADQEQVAAHATKLSANPCAGSKTVNWQKYILGRVICNRHSPHPVRVAALHHYAESLRSVELESGESASAVINVGALVAAELEPMRRQQALSDLAAVFGSEIRNGAAGRGAMASGERLRMEADYYLGGDLIARRGVSLGLALVDLARHSNDMAGLVSDMFRHPRDEMADLLNGLLFASCYIREQVDGGSAQLRKFQSIAMKEFSTRVLQLSDVDHKLSYLVQLDPWPLARISELDELFGRTYMLQLTQLNQRCQMAMLGDFILEQGAGAEWRLHAATKKNDAVAASETTVSNVVEKWQYLFVQPSCVILVREALGRDYARFQGLIGRKRPEPSAECDAIVSVWLAFYSQFLDDEVGV